MQVYCSGESAAGGQTGWRVTRDERGELIEVITGARGCLLTVRVWGCSFNCPKSVQVDFKT